MLAGTQDGPTGVQRLAALDSMSHFKSATAGHLSEPEATAPRERARALESVQQHVRIRAALDKRLSGGGGDALLMVRECKLVEFRLQDGELAIEVGSLTCKLFTGLPPGTQETEDKTTPQRAQLGQIDGSSHGLGTPSAAGALRSDALSEITDRNCAAVTTALIASRVPSLIAP